MPAESAEFSMVDKVFTRVGASDRILESKSTFFMELEETKFIMDNATKHSLVIMDELGRGTSTYDGYALAFTVLRHIHERIQSRFLFTTHYHWLVDDFKMEQAVKMFTMKIHEEEEGNLRFLYEFVEGAATGSFGMRVAEMAGLLKKIVERAKTVAGTMRTETGWKRRAIL